jgi:hypothetical protein
MTGDVFALPWLWGAIAEEWTAAIIHDLGPGWSFEHDIPREEVPRPLRAAKRHHRGWCVPLS